MAQWIAFPYDAADYVHDAESLRTHWARLHQGDAELFPQDEAVQAAWALFHAGQFQQAVDAGLRAGGVGLVVANKAQSIHANYLETREKTRLAMFAEVAERAEAQARADPGLASAHYWLAYALARCGQGMNVARARAQGLGVRIKSALEAAIANAPRHADAHAALGALRAEVIDRVGRQPGKARGSDAGTALQLFRDALALNPDAVIARLDYANALVMLEGDRRMKESDALYAEAAACRPADATERMEVEIAKAALEE